MTCTAISLEVIKLTNRESVGKYLYTLLIVTIAYITTFTIEEGTIVISCCWHSVCSNIRSIVIWEELQYEVWTHTVTSPTASCAVTSNSSTLDMLAVIVRTSHKVEGCTI